MRICIKFIAVCYKINISMDLLLASGAFVILHTKKVTVHVILLNILTHSYIILNYIVNVTELAI